VRPDFCTLVPERRAERTTEGGLDVRGRRAEVEAIARPLVEAGIGVSFFVDPDPAAVQASAALGATTIELHTGDYCQAPPSSNEARNQLGRLALAGRAVVDAGMHLAAGHGQVVRLTAISAAVRSVAEVLCLEDELGIPREEAGIPAPMLAADTSGQAAPA